MALMGGAFSANGQPECKSHLFFVGGEDQAFCLQIDLKIESILALIQDIRPFLLNGVRLILRVMPTRKKVMKPGNVDSRPPATRATGYKKNPLSI